MLLEIGGQEKMKKKKVRRDLFHFERCLGCKELNRPEDLNDDNKCLKCQTRQTLLGGDDEINN